MKINKSGKGFGREGWLVAMFGEEGDVGYGGVNEE